MEKVQNTKSKRSEKSEVTHCQPTTNPNPNPNLNLSPLAR